MLAQGERRRALHPVRAARVLQATRTATAPHGLVLRLTDAEVAQESTLLVRRIKVCLTEHSTGVMLAGSQIRLVHCKVPGLTLVEVLQR